MDKRTLLFVIAASATLLLTNFYFDSQHNQKLEEWTLAQNGKKTKQLALLEQQIAADTAKVDTLPIVKLYADAEGKQLLTSAIASKRSVITLNALKSAPKVVYIKKEDAYLPLNLQSNDLSVNAPLVYAENNSPPITIADLPDIGKSELQLVRFDPSDSSVQIELAELNDGSITLIHEVIEKLKNEISESQVVSADSAPPVTKPKNSGIFLLETAEGFLPLAIYLEDQHKTLFLEDLKNLKTTVTRDPEDRKTSSGSARHYVLENKYQQLVFSSIGAALTEINLPFASSTNDKSVVRTIEFDRDIKNQSPQNDHFPSTPFLLPGKDDKESVVEHAEGHTGGYYPLLRRDIFASNNKLTQRVNPRYYALNLLSEFPELGELEYTVTHFDSESITFEAQQRKRKITKTFSFPKNDAPYTFDVAIKIEGDKKGIWVNSGVPEVELISGSPAPVLKYRITRNQKSSVDLIDLPKDATTNSSITPDWTVNSNGFFGIIIDPLTHVEPGYKATLIPGHMLPSRLGEIDRDQARFDVKALPGYMLMTPISTSEAVTRFRIFAGPLSDNILESIDAIYSDASTGYTPDYIASQSDHGWFSFISEPFAKILFVIMNFFHTITGSWGISIILLTIALRIMMYPLNSWSTKSIVKMQLLAPQIQAIQEKNKNNPKKAQMEVMELYRSAGANPLSGCLPMLIQMPFLIGMFDLLKTTVELRGASFIPGWIDNLTSPDVLFSWNTPLFLIGNQFHLLPILLGLSMYLQQKMSQTMPADPSDMTEQQKQQRMTGTMMSVVFAVMFYNFPSGLNIYWLSSTLLGMLQQWWTQRKMRSQPLLPVINKNANAPRKKV